MALTVTMTKEKETKNTVRFLFSPLRKHDKSDLS
ncbi:hypothetical protein Sulac_3553 (plasmid) [Sulfobacillus acidophilus DSM 10332]|uniref:Uncharacterized protein n=1 Tax=Sulfobacillus acidophilus (strain ATCC 700253 / DSM 10332 / NAL) TaxID=679936 RepID=G8U1Q8_SULAD|nr:hypothetical protein Sulac_3553 [Sulfobacillus acidophilus DSM 10332]